LAAPRKPVDLTFEEIKTLLTSHMNPKPLKCTERQKFKLRKQNKGESFAEFLAALKEIFINCGYEGEARLNEELRD